MKHPLYHPKPAPSQLRGGCILATISKALYSAATGFDDDFLWWEGRSYRRNSGSGDLGTLTFAEDKFVGLFFDHDSRRSPWNPDRPLYDLDWYLSGIPRELRTIADKEAIPFLTYPNAPGGIPLVTCAIWSDGKKIHSREPWPNLFWHGLAILHIELEDTEKASLDLESVYDLTPTQMGLLRELYRRKLGAPSETVALDPAERELLVRDRPAIMDDWQRQRLSSGDDDAAIALCRELLAAVGINLP
jgi:hypothetical protein